MRLVLEGNNGVKVDDTIDQSTAPAPILTSPANGATQNQTKGLLPDSDV